MLIFQPFFAGCIRRSDDIISEDYDEIDRRNPPVFINNTRTQVVVAEGKDARLDCRVSNVGNRTVRTACSSAPCAFQSIGLILLGSLGGRMFIPLLPQR